MEVCMHVKRTRRIIILLGGVALLFSLNFFLNPEDAADKDFLFPEKNFETPEAAINHFVVRLAANDLPGAFEACAVNEGDKFDFKAMTERLDAIVLYGMLSPSQSPVLAQVNRIAILSRLANQVKFMLYSMLTDISFDGRIIPDPDEQMVDSFIKDADSRKLAGLTVEKIRLPAPAKIYNSERAKKSFMKSARCYGADDAAERLVLYRLNDAYFAGGIHLLKYGKYWRIDSLSSAYAGMPAMGNVKRITREQFDEVY
jgi:hypothetical protein